jgi:hypothetical protein
VRSRALAIPALLLASTLVAQGVLQRRVDGNTLVSTADPSASFTFDKAFVYAGGQAIDIFKVAGAEQYFFLDAAPDRSVRRFYWIQFERYYPDNKEVYDYSRIPQKPVDLGRLAFMGDVRVRPKYFTMDDRPGSDSMAAADFLRAKGYRTLRSAGSSWSSTARQCRRAPPKAPPPRRSRRTHRQTSRCAER